MRLVILLFSLFLSACDKPSQGVDNEQAILSPCPGFIEMGKPPLVYGAECGELQVKENPDDPASRTITLYILRLPSISPAAKADPLFFIQGGPGGSSVDLAKQLYLYFVDVRTNRDLVFVDQRGTGKSNPLKCEALSEAEQLLPEAEQTAKYLRLLKTCADKYRKEAAFYTTPYAVRDLDLVRRALGYQQINLWGGSYGTRIALEYMRQFPQHTRVSVLDGVAPVQIALPKYFQEDAMAALRAVNEDCQVHQECVKSFGDIIANAETVRQRLAHAQQAGNTIKIMLEHPRNQQKVPVVLTPRNFSMLIFMALYSRDLTVLLPRAIERAEQEDYRLLGALFVLSAEQSIVTGIADAMHFSVICNEDAQFISAENIADAKPFFGNNMVKERAEICSFWPKSTLPDSYWLPVKSAIPSLLLSGAHDPVTPARWADLVASQLKNSTHLQAPGGNHIISTEGCMPKIIARFIEKGSMHGIDAACVQKIKPLALVLGANEKKENSSDGNVIRMQASSVAGSTHP